MYYVNLVLKHMGLQQLEEPQDPVMQNLLHIIKFKFVAPRGYISPTEQLILNYQKRYDSTQLARFTELCNGNTPLESIFEELGFPIKPSQQILNEIRREVTILKNPGNTQLDFDFNQILFSSPSSNSNSNNPNQNSNPEKSNSNSISDILIYGVLHQGIAWIADLGNHNLDFAVDLVSILLDFISYPQLQSKTQIIQHIDCIFSLLIKGFLNDYSLDVTDQFVAAVLAYLVGSNSITDIFSEIYNSFFARVINSGLPRSISHILRVTHQFIDEHRPFIQIEDATQDSISNDQNTNNTNIRKYSSLFKINILAPLIKALDSNLIELICIGSVSTDKFLENIRILLDLLATTLCENISESNDSDISKRTLEANDSPDLEITDFQNDYTFLNEGSEVTDLKYNSSELIPLLGVIGGSSKNIKDYLPKKSINAIILISVKFVKMNVKYLESFLTIVSNNVIANIGKPYYIELYAMMIFLFEKLSGKFSLTTFKESILSPVIFNIKYDLFNTPPSILDKIKEKDQNAPKPTNNNNNNNNADIFEGLSDDDEKFLIISDFRYFTFHIVASNSQTLLYQLLKYASSKSPYLFSEQIMRICHSMINFKIELFCGENVHELILNSSYQLQQLYIQNPLKETRLARISIFEFYFKIIEDSSSFLLSSTSPIFSKCFFHFLFEPSLTTLFLDRLRSGFVNVHVSFTIPIFIKLVPTICEILDYVSSKHSLILDERYTNLANQIIHCITDSLFHNLSLIFSFVQVFPSILNYVWKNPSQQLLQECFSFLSILSQSSSSFYFSSEMFQLLADIIRSVEGKEPSLETQLKFYGMMSGSNQTLEDALYLIKAPQFIPLILVSYSQSTRLTKLIEYFSSLCKYSPSNCVACNKGDLDFLLLQILKYKNSFEYNGYRVDFLIDLTTNNYESLGIIFNLISHIIFVKTNVVIVDQLFQLTLPISSYFQPHFAQNILLLLLNLITTEVNKKRPIFDIFLNKPICRIKGLTDKEVNGNITISFWVKLDIPLLLSFSESLTLFSIENHERSVSFKVLVNGEALVATLRNTKGKSLTNKNPSSTNSSIRLIEQVPSNEWVLFTFDFVKQQSDNKTALYVFKFSEQVGFATFNNFNFPNNSKITLAFGCGNSLMNKEKKDIDIKNLSGNKSAYISNYKIIGQLGPFCIFDPQSDLHNNQQFPFISDPNFENFKSAIITSSNIIQYYINNSLDVSNIELQSTKSSKMKNSKIKIKNKNNSNDILEIKMQRFEISLSNLMHCGDCLNDVLFYVYDLNYLTYLLTSFTPKDYEISIQILEIILTCLSSSAFAQKKYISIPILSKSIPTVFKGNLNYKLYLTLFNALTAFRYEPLIKDFLDFIIFNFELWGNSDMQSLIRIMKHWATSVIDIFSSTKSSFLKISRLLAVFDIVFFSESKPEVVFTNDFGSQTDFTLKEMCLLHSFSINHTKEEVQQIKEEFLNFIELYVSKSMTAQIATSISYHLFESSNKEKTILLLNLLDRLGPSIKQLDPTFQLNFVKPLQYFFNTDDIDIIISAIFATYSLASQNNLHYLLTTASIQIQLNSNYKLVFNVLLNHIKEKCNLYSLICLLSLSLGQEEQNKAVLVIKELLNDPELSNSVEQSTFWSIWLVILGLYNTSYGSKIKFKDQNQDKTIIQTNLAIITEFFANQILRFPDVCSEFKNFLSVVLLLANDWKTAAFEFESELTFVLSKHIFASNNENIVKNKGSFLRMAFNSIFFSSVCDRNRALFEEYSSSPFYRAQLMRRATLPVKNLYNESNVNSDLDLNSNANKVKMRANSSIFEDVCKMTDPVQQQEQEDDHQPKPPKNKEKDGNPPFDSFISFTSFNQGTFLSSPTFQLRIDEENKWVDSKLCSTLVSMIPCVEKPHPSLQIFKEVADFIRVNYPNENENEVDIETRNKRRTSLNYLVDIQNKIGILQDNSISFSNKMVFAILSRAFEAAQKMIFDSLQGLGNGEKTAVYDIEKELIRMNSRHDKYKEALNEVEKNFVFPRNPDLIIQLYKKQNNNENEGIISSFFKRDNCSCFDLCPVKTKPVIKEKSFKIWELRQTHSNDDNSMIYHDVETQTEYVEDDSEQEEDKDCFSQYKKNKYSIILPCSIIKATKSKEALFLLSSYKMCLVLNNSNSKYQIPLNENDPTLKLPNKIINIQFHKIMSIFKRKRYQKNTAIEIFLINGETYLIDFEPVENDELINQLADHPLLSMQQVQKESTSSYFLENKQRTTSLWASGQMSNFTYLMALNTFSGRTFNDILQYPIFPLITNDLQNISRNLSFPISYQPKKKENQEEEEELNEELFEDAINLEIEKMFHTSPVPSSTVEDCLIRIEPFTSYYLKMQSGRFKFDKKVVSSLSLCNDSELPPEFYFCPEIFQNNNKIIDIPDFQLSKNCSNPFELVYKHRKLLESDEVSAKLNEWIDLIWGCKQSGKLALKYHNYLHPFIMQDVWEHEASLLVEAKRQVLSMMRLYGIMPQQLFTDLHPPRIIKDKSGTTDDDNDDQQFKVVQKKVHSIPLIYASCIADNCFMTIDSRGKVITCVINMNLPDLINKEISRIPLKIAPGTITCPIEKGLLLLSPSTESISIFQYGSLHTYKFFTSHFVEINVKDSNNISSNPNSGPIPPANLNPAYSYSQKNPAASQQQQAESNNNNENTDNNNNNASNNNNDGGGADGDANDENANENGNDNANANDEYSNDGNLNDENGAGNDKDGAQQKAANGNAEDNKADGVADIDNEAAASAASSSFNYENYYTNDDDFEIFIHSNLGNFVDEEDSDFDDEIPNDSDFIMIDAENEQLQLQRSKIMHVMSMMNSSNSMFSNFDSIYGSQKYFLLIKDRSIINVYDTLTFPQKLGEIIILEDVILHCQVSQQFNVIAVLSRSGLIHIHSLSTLQKTAVIDLSNNNENNENNNIKLSCVSSSFNNNSAILSLNHKKPRRMVITPRWCFIVVDFGCSKFDVYSINGNKIKESRISFLDENKSSIYSWTAVSSLKDFDYIIFVDTKGNIGYFEAFDPSNMKFLTHTNSTVCHMDYCRSEDCIYVLTTQGNIIFIEHPFVIE